MSGATSGLRVALLCSAAGGAVAERLADGLAGLGQRPVTIGPQAAIEVPPAERMLAARGFAGGLTRIPFALAALARDGCDAVHAFSEIDAQAALAWRRLAGVPVIFTPTTAPTRENLAAKRLSLAFATRSYEESDAVVAPSEEIREAARRWLALDLELIQPGDAEGYAAVYRRCVGTRTAAV